MDEVVLREVSNTVNWIKDHRHDPSEIYDDEFLEDLKKIPDPNIDPLKIIDDFLDVLETMGKNMHVAFVLVKYNSLFY